MGEIVNPLPVPELCDNCCSMNVELVVNERKRAETGEIRYLYACRDCRATVGCHPGTVIPFGRMADGVTGKLRSLAHKEFDRLWFNGYMTREKAYAWLAMSLGIEVVECHISQLSKSQLKDVITMSADYFEKNYTALVRRREKRRENERERDERDNIRYKRESAYNHKQKRQRVRKQRKRTTGVEP